ncbi:hypothetical protein C8Q75DRAFT_728396 [Abortiporus biennis]|nr:hypothetical protein C8Q75DRAFT_728396 [Abortiporus biennis]
MSDSESLATHRYKPSMPDSPLCMSQMRIARNRLRVLRERLDRSGGRDDEAESISELLRILQDILRDDEKPVVSQSPFRHRSRRKISRFQVQKGNQRSTNCQDREYEAVIRNLHSKLKELYSCVLMDVCGYRMIIHAILLALPDMISTEGRAVSILPAMRLADAGHFIQLSNPSTGFQFGLNGHLDYLVIEYEDVGENKGKYEVSYLSQRVVSPGGSLEIEYALNRSRGRLLVVERKQQDKSDISWITDSFPEAISQAIALLKCSDRLTEIPFCLSDGKMWIFFILKLKEDGTLVYYHSTPLSLDRFTLERSDSELRVILFLLCQWVSDCFLTLGLI